MKKLFKKLSLMVVALLTFSVGSNYTVKEVRAADYVETTFGEGKFLITTSFEGKTYYLPATTSASSGPLAKEYTDVNSIGEEHLWTVTATGSNYYIQNSEGKYLYTTNNNNGVRVNTTNNAWTYNATENSLKDSVTSRYLGIYSASNWRCYTTVNQSNYKESSTSFKFYMINAATPSVTISGDSYTEEGKNVQLSADLSNVEGTITWKSSDTSVATIDENGLITAKSMGATTITATVNGTEGTLVFIVYPIKNSELTIAEALEVCTLTDTSNAPYVYSVTGTVKSIDTAYDPDYDNITVTITDGTNSIKAFRMTGGSELQVEDIIKVTGTLVNYLGTTPEFIQGCTYDLVINDNLPAIISSLNNVNSYMSLAYSYKETIEQQEIMDTTNVEYIDTLNKASTTAEDQNYVEWTYNSNISSVNYAGQSAGSKDSIQLRSNNNNSGIVTTNSTNNAKKITVTWQGDTSNGRTLNVYGSNTAYSKPTDLYDSSKQGTLLGTIVCGTSTELIIEGEYNYIGLRSASGAMYLTEIIITWEKETSVGTGEFENISVMSEAQFYIRCGVDTSLDSISNIDSYGIRVSAGDNVVEYKPDTATSWGVDSTYDYCYVVLNLGNIFDNEDKLTTEFTVSAFVEVDGIIYTSEKTKTYSVVSMIEYYYTNGDELVKSKVSHLYNYFEEKGYYAA